MPTYSIQGPDGKTYSIDGPPNATREQIIGAIQARMQQQPPAQPERTPGIIESGIAGAKKLGSSIRTAVETPFGVEEAAQAGLARARALEEKTPSALSLDKVKEKYAKEGFFPAAGEVLSQAPNFIMEQLPQLGTAFAGGRLGAIAGAPLGPYGAIGGGIAGAIMPLAFQAYGAGAERRAAEGLPQDPGKTAVSAAGQAGMEYASMVFPFGGKLMSRILGIAEKEGAQALMSPAARKLAEERLAVSLAKGTPKGLLAEIPTEVGQQMLERWQANMPLMDDNAIKEYTEAAYGAALFGGPFGGVGRRAQVGQAREQVTRADALEATKKAKELREAEAAEKAKPEYILGIADRHDAAKATLTETQQQLKASKPGKDATEGQQDIYAGLQRQYKEQIDAFKPLKKEYDEVKLAARALRTSQLPERPAAPAEPAVEAAAPVVQSNVQQMMDKYREAQTALTPLETQMQEAAAKGDTAAINELVPAYQQQQTQLQELGAQIEQLGGVTKAPEVFESDVAKAQKALDKQIKVAQKKLTDAAETGDFAAMPSLATKLDELKAQQAEQQAKTEQQREVLRVNAVPVGDTLPMFSAEATPKQEEVIKPKEAAAGPLPQEKETQSGITFDLFSDFNLLNTAIQNRDERTLANMQRARDAADKKALAAASSKLSPRDEVYEALKENINKIVRRERNYDVYEITTNKNTADEKTEEFYVSDDVAKEISDLRRKVEEPIGNAKRSMLQIAHDNYATYEARLAKLEAAKAAKVSADKITTLNNQANTALRNYTESVGRIKPYRDKLDAAMAKLYKTTEVATPRQKAADTAALGKSAREMSREAKQAKKAAEGKLSASSERVAKEIGYKQKEYQDIAQKAQKRLDVVRKKYGDNSPELVSFIKTVEADLNKKAMALGRATPEFRSQLLKETKAFREAASQSTQEIKSKRTTQATRRLPKLSTMTTGSAESQAASAARQEGFRRNMTGAERKKTEQDFREGADDAGLAFRGGESSAQDTKTKTLIVDILSTRLSTQEKETLAEHYGEPVNSAGFLAKVREDIVKFAVKGAQSVAASIRNIIRKLQAAIVGAAIILNPNYIGPGYQVAIPQNVTTVEQVLAKVPESVRTKMSSGAQQAYANIMPAIQADLKKSNKLFILTDKPNARVFVFDSNGQPILDKKVLLGLQTGDYYKGNTDVKANRFTPAGLFNMGLRDATRSKGEAVTAGDYDFGKVFVLDKAIDGKYSITLFHSVYTKMSDAQARQKALAKDSAEDSRYSFGCINVDKETYKYLLDNYETQMDGAKLFIVPDTPNATMDFVRGKATTAGDITRQAAPEVTRKVTKTVPGTPSTASSRMELAARKEEGIRPGDSGMVFRVGEDSDTVVDAAKARALIATTLSNLPKGVNLVYSPTLAGIKPDILERLVEGGYEEGTSFKGVVLSDGTIVVVGDQHSSVADLEATLFHEMIGHYGVDTVIGMDRLQQYANKTDVIKLAETLGGSPLVREAIAAAAFAKKQEFSPEIQKLQALREIIAYTAEKRITENFRQKASRWLKEFVGMMRASLRQMGFENAARLSTSDVYYAIKLANKAFNDRTVGPYRAKGGMMAFRSKREGSRYGGSFVAGQNKIIDDLRGNMLGLSGRVQFVDQYAALDAAIAKGLDAGVISDLEAEQAGYYLRFGQQANAFATQALTNGPLALVKQVTKRGMEFVYKSAPGASMVKVAQALEKSGIKNSTELEHMFTIYTAGKRAKQVGWNKLNFEDPAVPEADYNRLMEELKGNDKARAAFEDAAKIYKEYNNGLVDFAAQTGYLSKQKAAELKAIDYVPFYRVQGGELQLMVDKERPIRIANMKDEPMLHELVGGNKEILPIFTSSAQNAFVLTRMGLRNQMMKDNIMLLGRLGIASKIGKGAGPEGAIRYKVKGEDNFAVIDSDMYGIPAELIVKGMEGIKTTIPMAIKVMGMPANVLRKFITRNPAYAVRQAIRDPLTAWFTTGTDGVPVLNSFVELSKMVAGRSKEEIELMQGGAISSNVMTGDEQDMAKAMRDMSLGRSGWTKLMMKADALAMQGDAATRAVIYKDSLAKGMSEMQAFMRTLESMNFSRRGLSPSMQMLSTVIPFFNAQIQGLDVLYRTFTGKMPYSEQLKIRQKLYTRGLLLAAGTLAYAAAMEDDEAYKRAKPEERLGNWFVYTPFSDEPMRIPIPFELGYLFKALPEAVFNTAAQDERADDITKGMGKLVALSNPFALPAAIKPLTEVVLGRSFFGGDIESKRELNTMMPGERSRDTTTEIAKMLGSVTGDAGLTPIKIDYLIRGYTGGLGVAIASLANPILNTEASAVEKPTMKTSKMPFIGGLFQPVEGRGTLDAAYERILEIQQVQGTYNRLLEEGKDKEADALLNKYENKLVSANFSGRVREQLGKLAIMRRNAVAADLTRAEKDEMLKDIDEQQVLIAREFLSFTGKTRPQ